MGNLYIRNQQDTSFTGTYIEGEIDRVYVDKFYLKYKSEYILVYSSTFNKPGDKISIVGVFNRPVGFKDNDSFNYREYLKRKQVYLICYPKKIELISNGFNINTISYYLRKYINDNMNFNVGSYVNALVLGNKDYLDEDVTKKLSFLGISHLFAISGLHISFIVVVLKKILGKLKHVDFIINIVLIALLIITGFSASVIRASLLTILSSFVIKKKLPFDSLDILSFIFVVLIMYNPYYFYDIGFRLSFLVSFSFVISSSMLEGNYLVSTAKTSTLALLVTLPIIVNINNQVNFICIVANIGIIFFFSNIILPGCFICFFIPILSNYFVSITTTFEIIIKSLANISILNLNFPYFSPVINILYYGFLFYLLRNIDVKRVLLFIVFLYSFINYRYITPCGNVYFFEVGQGDTTLVTLPFNRGNMVVDCFNDGYKKIIKKGIKQVDYLVITHGHDDHINASYNLINNIDVQTLVVSKYDDSSLLRDLITFVQTKNINVIYLSQGDSFYLDNIKIYVLLPNDYDDNLNNISLVLYFKIHNKSFLLMGDMEDKEIDIPNLSVDYFKVGHHGSKTATKDEFLEKVNFDVAIISCGENNKFNFPDEELIERLESKDCKIYLISNNGTYEVLFFI